MISSTTAANGSPLSIRPKHPKGLSLNAVIDQFSLRVDGKNPDGVADPKFISNTVTRLLENIATGVTLDSRDVRSGDLYLALPGTRRHGAEFSAQVEQLGAVAILTDEAGAGLARDAGVTIPVLITDVTPRPLAGPVAAAVYRTVEIPAKIFGVTGTNGKTSVIYMLDELLRAAGLTTGLSSTAERRIGDLVITSNLTSPEAPELQALLARMAEEQVGAISLEVSAHATVQHRIDGVAFDVMAFNNFSQDHLDDFADMESYFAAKSVLFTPEHATRGVVVVDSAHGRRIYRESKIPLTTLSTEYGTNADWHLAVTAQDLNGVSFVLQGPAGAHFIGKVPLFGRFMAENAALALIMIHEAGIPLEQVAAGLDKGLIPVYVPGRLEAMNPELPLDRGPRFYLDYGHTAGAFAATLDALQEVVDGRIIFMFGADGDRDTTKREEMGRVAAAGSDVLIVCDYHPRSEPPEAIRAQLITGAHTAPGAVVFEEGDPRAAIRLAIAHAGPGDVIVYAGPGHEDYQEVAGEYLQYSARDEVRGALREAGLLA